MTFSSAPSISTALPDPHAWATAFVRAVGETLSGRRPASSLAAFATADVREILHRRPVPTQRGPRQAPRPPLVRRVQVRQVAEDVVEANAVLLGPDGGQAIAFRMEARRDRWICTALETQRPAHLGTRPQP